MMSRVRALALIALLVVQAWLGVRVFGASTVVILAVPLWAVMATVLAVFCWSGMVRAEDQLRRERERDAGRADLAAQTRDRLRQVTAERDAAVNMLAEIRGVDPVDIQFTTAVRDCGLSPESLPDLVDAECAWLDQLNSREDYEKFWARLDEKLGGGS